MENAGERVAVAATGGKLDIKEDPDGGEGGKESCESSKVGKEGRG